jgi:hypothetical protein
MNQGKGIYWAKGKKYDGDCNMEEEGIFSTPHG